MKTNPTPKNIGVNPGNLTQKLFDKSLSLMGKSLNLRLSRHGLTSSNLANQNTPGYRVRDVKFEKIMSEAALGLENRVDMTRTSGGHMPTKDLDSAYQAAQKNVEYSLYGQDAEGNDVMDLDQEMNKLAKNHLVYNATVQMLAKEFEMLKYSISEGGR